MVQPETADIAPRKGQRSAVFPTIAMAQDNLSTDIPISDGHHQATVQEPRSAGEPGGSDVLPGADSPKTILVVDDQPAVCASVSYYLEVCGYKAPRAGSGQGAIDLVRKQHVDGILMDIQMPGLNGLQTCAQLQVIARETGRQFKVWFMTGVHYRGLEEECAKAGGMAVFRKPFDWPQTLIELARGLALLSPRPESDMGTGHPPT
jgi:CheY-like chemotaxis protein